MIRSTVQFYQLFSLSISVKRTGDELVPIVWFPVSIVQNPVMSNEAYII